MTIRLVGVKKPVSARRSSICRMLAAVSTGSANSCSRAEMNRAQIVSGMRIIVMPGARILTIVVT